MIQLKDSRVNVILSNISNSVQCCSLGAPLSYLGTETDISVIEGDTALVYDGKGVLEGTWRLTLGPVGINSGTVTNKQSFVTIGQASYMSSSSAYVRYYIDGTKLDGTIFSTFIDQNFTKALSGATSFLHRIWAAGSRISGPDTNDISQETQEGYRWLGSYSSNNKEAQSPDSLLWQWTYMQGVDGVCKYNCLVDKEFIPTIYDILTDVEMLKLEDIDNQVATVDYSNKAKSKSVIGVLINHKELDPKLCEVSLPYPWPKDYSLTYSEVEVHSIGEGKINVCKDGGNIEVGDYICSSKRIGKGQKQDDDFLHNYTVAKAREACNWAENEDDIRTIVCIYCI